MHRSNRLFEIIQILRGAVQPLTARDLSQRLEVSERTVYRDIAALQAMRTPIEGEAGIGYVMRRGYDLPPLNFDAEEVEALHVGLSMLARSGDSALQKAAARICGKIEALQCEADWLQVSPWGAPTDDPSLGCVSVSALRDAIRTERKLFLRYCDEHDQTTERTVRPVAVMYYPDCVLLAGWCETRNGFRHFRVDRIDRCDMLEEAFVGQGDILRQLWLEKNRLSSETATAPV